MSATLSRGYTFGASETVTNTKLHTLIDSGTITNISNDNIASDAAIAYSKIDLGDSITDADIDSSAGIAYSKLDLAASITRTDIATGYGLVPSGAILMWSGTIATIPTGWYLCDGNNSTPDLRDMFIVGAKQDDSGVAKTNITGSLLQSHATGLIPAHTHTMTANGDDGTVGGDYMSGTNAGPASHSSTTTTGSYGTGTKVIAVFYALAFIMKS